jgi:hypothetical protein
MPDVLHRSHKITCLAFQHPHVTAYAARPTNNHPLAFTIITLNQNRIFGGHSSVPGWGQSVVVMAEQVFTRRPP